MGNKIIVWRRADSRQQSAASRKLENNQTKKTLTRKIQVRVSLSLRLWWIVAIAPNPPYAVPYIHPPNGRKSLPVGGLLARIRLTAFLNHNNFTSAAITAT